VVVLAVVGPACSLLTDTDGLTSATVGENADASAGDTGAVDADVADAGGADAGDGAGLPTDASIDGDAQRDAGKCPPGAMVLCDDFERLALIGAWGGKTVQGGVTLDLASEGTSRFLRATSPALAVGADLDGELWVEFVQTGTAAFYDYDLRYSGLPTSGSVELQTIYFRNPPAYSEIFLVLGPGGVSVIEQAAPDSFTSPITMLPGVWHHVSVEAHVGGVLLVKIDGAMVVSKPLEPFVVAGKPSVSAAIVYGTLPPTALTVDVDNIVFRATP
jgi:hypothetical protein